MSTREDLLEAALSLIEVGGEGAFSTRAVCEAAKVKAPTLYHHFGSSDGLLAAAIDRAFDQFLERKEAVDHPDEVQALRLGWDDYVAFAHERPRLYAAMITRLLQGVALPPAVRAREILVRRLESLGRADRLAIDPEPAADLLWASAHAAAMLAVVGRERSSAETLDRLRSSAMNSILKKQGREP